MESNSSLANIDFYNATFDNGLGVPEPSAIALIGIGLLGLAWASQSSRRFR